MLQPRFALVPFLVGLSACLLTSDLDRLSSGGVGGSSDASRDGEIADGGGPAGDSGPCAHALCEDFDDDAALSRWTLHRGTLTPPNFGVDDRASTTPSQSLFYEAAQPLGYGASTHLSKVVTVGEKGGLTCSFDMRVDAFDGSFPILFSIGTANVDAPKFITLENMDTRLNVIQDPSGTTTKTDITLRQGVWTTLTTTLRRSPLLNFVVTDGIHTVSVDPQLWPATSSLEISLGLVFSRAATGGRKGAVRFDTVRCDLL